MRRKLKDVNLPKDPLSDLPDDVLYNIICMIDMKDAVKTSILSKRWRSIWTKHVVELEFNHVNILGLKFIPREEKDFKDFVEMVDNVMKLRCKGMKEKINSFCLQFPLGKSYFPFIDKWLKFAIRRRVETIDLDLSSHLQSAPRYNFSLLKIVSNYEEKTLKHLRLTDCNFRARSSSPLFGSLISLHLKSVSIFTPQLDKVLVSCTLLKELTLDTCWSLTKVTIDATLLKHLSLTNCFRLKEIDLIRAPNLVSLQLKDVFITSLQLRRFIERCPLLEGLTLNSCSQPTYLRIGDSGNNCTLLKHLSLIGCYNLEDIDVIRAQNLVSLQLTGVMITSLQLRRFIERCPLLEELTLNGCSKPTYLRIGDSENNCTLLKHLSLTNCFDLREIDVIRAQNLISLKLKNAMISNLQLTNIIESCPLLEELTLHSCHKLTYLKILESNNSRLKSLHLDRCYNLQEIDICANLLHTLEYNGFSQWFSFKKSPRLVNVFIGGEVYLPDGDELLVTTIARDIPSMENLILAPYHSLEFFHINDPEPVFSMRRLVLNVVTHGRKEELLWINSILNYFPLLEKLELNFKIKSRNEVNEKASFDKCPNRCITKLEVNGFEGNQHQVDLLEFLLENLTGLRTLAIGPCCKTYTSFNRWVNEKEYENGKKWFESKSEWLRTIIPPHVRLEFL